MIDLKAFRKSNKLGQSDIADYLGISVSFVSAFECGRAKLPENYIDMLLNNDRGWIVPEPSVVAEPTSSYVAKNDWPAIVASLSEKLGEQNKQIDRLLTIVEKLTSEKK